MKVDKSNPRHWLYLGLFGINTLIAIALRPFTKKARKKAKIRQVILYGHRLSGNLLALQRHIIKHHHDEFELTFLTMDSSYQQRLKQESVNACKAIHPEAIQIICKADAVISDHGLHSMLPLLYFSDVKFFDVWHGIPFKGFNSNDFKVQHRYTETWVASPLMAEQYEKKFGFPQQTICVTGYARTDRLVNPQETDDEIRKRFGLQHTTGKKLILFAPTWKQDADNRTLFPFDLAPEDFFKDISTLCQEYDAIPVMRTHLNAQAPNISSDYALEILPFSQFPDTEALLQISDVLICDWSSIAFDFLLMNRPTIFLDVPAPFAKGFSLGPEFRFDRVVGDQEELLDALKKCLGAAKSKKSTRTTQRDLMTRRIYSGYADGFAAKRCIDRLRNHLVNNESSR